MNLSQDTALFFADFGVPHTLVTRGPAPFTAIIGHEDRSALDGYVLARQYGIQYPATVGLLEGDHVQNTSTTPATNWTVRDPRAVNDGVLCVATLERRA